MAGVPEVELRNAAKRVRNITGETGGGFSDVS
jgi:hypothetical protein